MRLRRLRLSRGLFRRKTAAPAAARPARVVAVTPHKHAFVAQGAGRIQSRYVSQVGFEVGGRLTSREVDVGAVVKKGQKLAQLSAVDYQNKVTAAEADLSGGEGSGRAGRAAGGALPHPDREQVTRRGPSTRMRSRRCRVPKRRSSQPKPIFASRRTS